MMRCEECGEEIGRDDRYCRIGDTIMCCDCADRKYWKHLTCDRCGSDFGDGYYAIDGENICEECFADDYGRRK